jgi:hypothetical protein
MYDDDSKTFTRTYADGLADARETPPLQFRAWLSWYNDGDNLGGIPPGSTIDTITLHCEVVGCIAGAAYLGTMSDRVIVYPEPSNNQLLFEDILSSSLAAFEFWGSPAWYGVVLDGTAEWFAGHLDWYELTLWTDTDDMVQVADLNYGMNTQCAFCGISDLYTPHLIVEYTEAVTGRRRVATII